jgi:hypothetical protein
MPEQPGRLVETSSLAIPTFCSGASITLELEGCNLDSVLIPISSKIKEAGRTGANRF